MKKIWDIIRMVPILLALAFVPLIVSAKQYLTGLDGYAWASGLGTSIDVFLYWKGQALILLAFLMMLCVLVSFMRQSWMLEWRRLGTREFLCLAVYLILAVVSAVLSDYRSAALWGNYEQWEGLFVILAYGVLFTYVYLSVDSEWIVRLIVYGIIAGAFVMGLIGTFQFMGRDLFRGDLGQDIMKLMSEEKLKFSFNFPLGWVYATLYNPNYVGSYAALVLPILVGTALSKWKSLSRFWTVLAMAASCLMTVTLLGSQSLTGCVGVIASAIFLLVYYWPKIFASFGWKKIVSGAIGAGILAAVLVFLFPSEFQYAVDKLFHPKEDTHMVQQMISSAKGLKITTAEDKCFYLTLTGQEKEPLAAVDEEGNSLALSPHEGGKYYTFSGADYDYQKDGETIARLWFYKTNVTIGSNVYEAVRVVDHQLVYEKDKSWTIVRMGDEYRLCSVYNKIDMLYNIPAVGFADNQHFGDKRGYIWSRTIPLLKDYLVTGSGPSTFTFIFPNNDYVGKTNMNYDGVTVTKPHNMYLQIWMQTGFLSLAAFLLLFIWYFIKSLRLYRNWPLNTVTEWVGMLIMVSLLGYMVTGIANDSTVAVAPVFWGMLGFGLAVNRMVVCQREKK